MLLFYKSSLNIDNQSVSIEGGKSTSYNLEGGSKNIKIKLEPNPGSPKMSSGIVQDCSSVPTSTSALREKSKSIHFCEGPCDYDSSVNFATNSFCYVIHCDNALLSSHRCTGTLNLHITDGLSIEGSAKNIKWGYPRVYVKGKGFDTDINKYEISCSMGADNSKEISCSLENVSSESLTLKVNSLLFGSGSLNLSVKLGRQKASKAIGIVGFGSITNYIFEIIVLCVFGYAIHYIYKKYFAEEKLDEIDQSKFSKKGLNNYY